MSDKEQPKLLQRWNFLPVVGLIGLAACAAAWSRWPEGVARGYLVAHQFWLAIALGSLVYLMIYHLSGGQWGGLLRRTLESAALTLPLMAVLFIPVLLKLPDLYAWARPEEVAANHHLQHKVPYLNVGFFTIRTVVYFVIWVVLAWRLRYWSRQQDDNPDPAIKYRLARLSGPGLVLYGLTVTFASTDWLMSLHPIWFSTMFCMIFAALQLISALAFCIAIMVTLREVRPLDKALESKQFRTFGNMLLATVMFWAYVAYSQWMLTWSSNLPEEIVWYLPRLEGGWQWVGLGLIGLQFFLPFMLLLSSNVRKRPQRLVMVGYFLLCMCVVNWVWQVLPSFEPDSEMGYWPDFIGMITALVGIGGFWLTIFKGRLKAAPLLPKNDPSLKGIDT